MTLPRAQSYVSSYSTFETRTRRSLWMLVFDRPCKIRQHWTLTEILFALVRMCTQLQKFKKHNLIYIPWWHIWHSWHLTNSWRLLLAFTLADLVCSYVSFLYIMYWYLLDSPFVPSHPYFSQCIMTKWVLHLLDITTHNESVKVQLN